MLRIVESYSKHVHCVKAVLKSYRQIHPSFKTQCHFETWGVTEYVASGRMTDLSSTFIQSSIALDLSKHSHS